MTSAARVRRLERYYSDQQYYSSDAWARAQAEDAILKCCASLEQYALMYAEEIARHRQELMAAVPVLLALHQMNAPPGY